MNVYDQVHGLTQAIKNSEEFIQYNEAKQKVKDNPELAAIIKDFQTKQFALQAKQMSGQELTEDELKSIQEINSVLLRDPLAAEYMQKEIRFSIMMKDVYEILAEATGMGDMLG